MDKMITAIDKYRKSHDGITKYLGETKSNRFFSNAVPLLKKYNEIWQLADISLMLTHTINLLFSCDSALYGPCVLKICIPGPEVATEINCLRAYDGQGYVKLWDYSLTNDVLLVERVVPGTQMWDVKDYKVRARLMAERIKDLSFITCGQGSYPTYRTWMEGIHKKLTNMGGMEDPLFYLNEALGIYDELKQSYNRSCLLHGDMHQENLLVNEQGGYTIIDPKGVVDDPVMETARFLLNETPCEKEKILEMTAIMSPIIGVSETDMLKSMYIDAALGNCWTFEEHFHTQEAFEKSKRDVLEYLGFVYGLIKT